MGIELLAVKIYSELNWERISDVVIKITISLIVIGLKNSYFPLIHLLSCYRTVCYWTVLKHRPDVLKKFGPLYLTIIPRPTSNTWYSKTRMGQHRIGQIMKSVARCLLPESNKKITNHSTRKTVRVVAKLKNAGQPRHKIIQITGHARES